MKKSRGLRNNNPGNIRDDNRTNWRGEVSASNKKDFSFEEFKDIKYGYRALIKLLQNYRKLYNCQTMSEFITKWAPPHENNTAGYISRVCKEMQVPTNFVPDISDKSTMVAFASAISLVENGVPAIIGEVDGGWELL